MHYRKNILSAIALIVSTNAFALSVPSAPSISSYDEVRMPDGTLCRSSNYGPQLQVGVVGGQGSNNSRNDYDDRYGHEDRYGNESGVYAQLTIPIGGPERIDCSSLYDLMVKQKKLELEELEIRIRDAQARMKMAEMNLPQIQ